MKGLDQTRSEAMPDYAEIDFEIKDWAERHSLVLFTEFAGREARFAYVSSNDAECFQIDIQPPADGKVTVSASCIEGRRENEAPYEYLVATHELDAALDKIFQIVLKWMAPSERHFPKPQP